MKLPVVLLLMFVPCVISAQDKSELMAKGNSAFLKDDFKKAVSYFEKVTKKFPEDEMGYYWLGVSYFKLYNKQECYNALTRALEINDKNPYSYWYRGLAFIDAEMPEDAINDLNMAIKYNTQDSMLYYLYSDRGNAKERVHNYEGALLDAKKALESRPNAILPMKITATSLSELGRGEEAVELYKKINALDSADISHNQTQLGFILLKLERYEEALTSFNLAIKDKPNKPYPYNNRGYIKMKMKDYEGAMVDINKSIQLDPYNSYAFRNRALLYIELKESEKACNDLFTARKLGFDRKYGNEVNHLIAENCN